MDFKGFSFTVQGRLVSFDRPAVMGILNITSDSFYDGGRYNTDDAMLAQAQSLLDDGADIIDLGAASSRPGATLPPPEEEAERLARAVTLLRGRFPQAILSVDTCWTLPARRAIEAGADIINDIGGGDTDPGMFALAAELQVPYILMHGGREHLAHLQPQPMASPVDSLTRFFSERLDSLYRLGVKDVWIDPGFGFGKTLEDNYAILENLQEITSLFREPLLTALSRKRMIYMRLGTTPQEALHGTTALDAVALVKGSALVRVHDPKPAADTIRLLFPGK